jgi:hypothetical protein
MAKRWGGAPYTKSAFAEIIARLLMRAWPPIENSWLQSRQPDRVRSDMQKGAPGAGKKPAAKYLQDGIPIGVGEPPPSGLRWRRGSPWRLP